MPAGAFVFRAPSLSQRSNSIRSARSGDAMASSEDKSITCVDCGEEFLFTAGEQAFYRERGLTNEPTRCKNCREKRKAGRGGHPGGAGGGGGGAPRETRPRRNARAPRFFFRGWGATPRYRSCPRRAGPCCAVTAST